MRNRYNLSEFLSTSYAYIITKIFYKEARLIRRPFYLRGKKSLTYQSGLTLGHGCRFDLSGNKTTLCIGNNCEMGDYAHIVAHKSVILGNDVLIASKVFISDTNHGCYKGNYQDSPASIPNERDLACETVKIGNRVWIGENAVILAGSRIADGSIVGANTVVSGKFERPVIIAGIPGRIIKEWNDYKKEWETV